jgi:hypothetical protein
MLMKPEEALYELPAKSVLSVLEVLQDVRNRVRDGEELEEPWVIIFTRGGREVRGWFLDMVDDGGSKWLLLRVPLSDRDMAMNVMYLELHSVEGILVENMTGIAHLLSFGKIENPVREDVLSPLDLRRKVEKWEAKLAGALGVKVAFEADWQGLPKSDQAVWNVHDLIVDAMAAVTAISSNETGKEEFSKKLRKLKFLDSKEPGAELKGDTLTVKAPFDPKDGKRMRRGDLQSAIEALF